MSDPESASRKRFVAAIVLLALVLIATLAASRGPAPLSETAPPDRFSAGRARDVLRRLVGDGIPHPVGSPQNAVVRDRVIAEFRTLGYEPVVERDLACSPYGSCAWVENILATLPGREPGGTVILNAHYDSVPAGPGSGDDATGVATLIEVARALRATPQRHPILFLIDDGEEAGLLGAEAFVRRHRPAGYIAALVLEARGSSGPTFMFETSQDNRAIIDAYARGVARPATSSVFFSIYQRLPNGTNFTTFKEAGIKGMAAAFIGDPAQYHTALNRVGNIPDRTIQHMGDTALGVTREIAETGLAPARGNASYFDVLSLYVVRWPEALNVPLSVLALLALVLLAVLEIRAGRFSGRELAWSLGAGLLPLVFAGLSGYAVTRLVAARLDHAIWPASGNWLVLAAWACGIAAVALSALLSQGRARSAAIWCAVWIDAALLGAVAAVALSGAAYLFAVPAIVAALSAWTMRLRGKAADSSFAAVAPLVTAALLVFPLALALFEGMGAGILFVIAIAVAIAFTPLLPMLAGTARPLALALTSLAILLVAIAAVFIAPVYSPEVPRPFSVVYQMDRGSASGRWLAEMSGEIVPAPLRNVADWREARVPSLAIGREERAVARTSATAPALAVAFPEARVVAVEPRGTRSRLRVEIRSPRGARVMRLRFGLKFDPRLVSVADLTLDGGVRTNGVIIIHDVPPEGTVVGVEIDTSAQGSEFAVDDETPGLPPAGSALLAARAADSVPAHRGDRTLLTSIGQVPVPGGKNRP